MLFSFTLVFVSLLNILCDFHVSSCDTNCTDKPVFTPSRLVVKHGDSASATCSVCQSACNNTIYGLENSVGSRTINGTTISWEVDSLTEWGTELTCYYNDDVREAQCCSILPITVYKPPDNVSISINNHTGPMIEGHQYTLLCEVQNVAPVQNVIVTFYRGTTPLGQQQYINNTNNKPVTERYALTITPSKEDDGVQYWCKAELELGPEGPKPPPVVTLQNIRSTVHYEPWVEVSSHTITITEGDPLHLNCSAVGNPTPTYTWTFPSNNLPQMHNNSVFNIKSAAFKHEGTYTCSATNRVGSVKVSFTVEVQGNYIPYIIIATLLLVVLVLAIASVMYSQYYRRNRMGQYKMKDVFRLHKQLIPMYNA
uniref:Ig-like domain-containing protein n=1 Tax=Anabas testudineus TaxID=64144 RepID=A0A3Q1HPS2_ANATE